MKTTFATFAAALLTIHAANPVLAQQIPAGRPSSVLTNLTLTSNPVSDRLLEQARAEFDAGDSYVSAKGKRSLHRLAGAVALRPTATSKAAVAELTASGATLDGYEHHGTTRNGFVFLKAKSTSSEAKDHAVQGQKLNALRNSVGVSAANPLFVDPESSLWLINTEEIIIALKPGIDAQGYFGAEWDRVRPLFAKGGKYVLKLASADSEFVFAEVSRRAGDPRVEWAEPNFTHQILPQLLPNDLQFTNQWHLRNTGQTGGSSNADIKATAAWDITTGNRSVIVAVLDTGIDLNHPDLVSNIATNTGEIPGNGIDDDGNGYVDDVRGWDFYGNDNNANPNTAFDSHGTSVAGAAIAAGNNNIGVAGVAYNSRLMPLRIGESVSEFSFGAADADIAEAIYYAAGAFNTGNKWFGADVIVISFESFQNGPVDAALNYAAEHGRRGRGCPVFVAMGNHGSGWQKFSLNGFSAGTYAFAWQYSKNASVADGEDAAWVTEVNFPGGAVERFDGATFPPSGWTTSGNANWTRTSDPAHAYGPSLFAARTGVIGNSQSSTLQTTRLVGAGSLVWMAWVSSEQNNDMLSISVGGSTYYPVSGIPFTRSGPSYPATHTNVIAVGATTHFDTRADYSQFGGKIDIMAPGGGGGGALLLSTDRTGSAGYNTAASPGGDYDSNQGTSLANPVAAGVAALMYSVNSNLTALQVRDILRTTADKVGSVTYTNGTNAFYGYGRVNAQKAVIAALGTANDTCSNALVISPITSYSHTQSTVYVSANLDHPDSCGFQTANDVWYTITLPSPGLLSVTTSGSDFDTVLSTYAGSCGSLVALACNDDVIPGTTWSTNGVFVTAGTYFIQVAGYNGKSGTLVLRANFTPGTLGSGSAGVSNVLARSAVLLGNVNPSYSTATAWFEFGTNPANYDFSTPLINSLNGQSFSMTQQIFDLTPGAIYYCRVVVSNAVGVYHSSHQIFSAATDRTTVDVTYPTDLVFGTSTNSPVGETTPYGIDNIAVTKYLNFDKLNTGLTIVPSGNRIVRALTLISAEDAPERDPSSFMLEGSDDGVTFTTIASNSVPLFPTRHFIHSFSFANTNDYNVYRVRFPTVLNAVTANSMQIAEVELLPYPEITSTNDSVSIKLPGTAVDVRGVRSLFDRQLDEIRKLEVAPIFPGAQTIVDTVPAAGPTVVKGFQLIGAADDFIYPERRPQNVTLSGSNDGTNYTQIASVIPIPPIANNQIQEFSCATNSNAWTRYRITFSSPVGGDRLQLGEMRLFGDTVVAPPRLLVRSSGNNLLVSWTNAAGFNLEAKSTLDDTNWIPVGLTPLITNGVNSVTIPITATSVFLRLRK